MPDGARVVFDQQQLNELLSSPRGAVGITVLQTAYKVERAAKHLCPVDTGRLRSSIAISLGIEARGLSAHIGSDVEYAPFVEFGTRFQSAQPFLRPALAAVILGGLA